MLLDAERDFGLLPLQLARFLVVFVLRIAEFRDEIIRKNAPEAKPWGMYVLAVRVGWPTRLRNSTPRARVACAGVLARPRDKV
jgi:hypothetical protein